jgi:hypothetical protein
MNLLISLTNNSYQNGSFAERQSSFITGNPGNSASLYGNINHGALRNAVRHDRVCLCLRYIQIAERMLKATVGFHMFNGLEA